MRIELDIPDWAADRRLLIIAGTELVAMKRDHEDHWLVKETRCNHCGECCLDSPPTPYGLDEEGRCVKLKRIEGEWMCTAGMGMGLRCVLDPNIVGYEACCITHREVKA